VANTINDDTKIRRTIHDALRIARDEGPFGVIPVPVPTVDSINKEIESTVSEIMEPIQRKNEKTRRRAELMRNTSKRLSLVIGAVFVALFVTGVLFVALAVIKAALTYLLAGHT
jgi:hypothetical protein